MWNPFRSAPVQPAVKRKARTAPVFKVSTSRSLFSAADPDRSNSGWTTHPVPIGKMIDQKLVTLVARSREQISNNDYARGFVREVRKNVLGHKGIVLQVRGKEPDG
ncbi:phage portal protein, partial [Vibrio cholerae]